MADTRDPTVMAGLRSKYVARGREMPVTVTSGQPVGGRFEGHIAQPGHRHLPRDWRDEVWQDGGMARLFNALPDWHSPTLVLQGVTTVSLFKTRERQSLRPVGVMTPLIRTLHSHVIIENRVALTKFL